MLAREAHPLLSVQVDDRERAQLPVYFPPTKRARASVAFDALGLLGFGGFAVWSWWKGGNREPSVIATVAAFCFGGKAVLDFSTARGLRPRMVNFDAMDGVRGFVPIGELGIRRQEVIELLEDLAEKVVRNQTSDRRFSDRGAQTSWQKINRLIDGILGSSAAPAPAPASIDRSGQILTSILLQIQDQNETLQRQLSIEAVDDSALGECLLPERRDLGEHTATWNTLDDALRTYTYLQVQNNARRLFLQVSGAYESLNRALAPLATSLKVDLRACVSGKPENLFATEALNKSHHSLICGFRALNEKAKELNSSIEEQARKVEVLCEKLSAANEASDRAARKLEAATRETAGTTSELEEQLRRTKEEVASLTEQLEVAQGKVEQKSEELSAFEERARVAESLRDESEKLLEAASRESAGISELEERLRIAESAAKEAKGEIASLTKQLEAARAELEQKSQELAALEERALLAENAREVAERKFEAYSRESTSTTSELEKQFRIAESAAREAKEKVASLTKQLEAARAELEQKSKELSGLEKRVLAAESARDDSQGKLELVKEDHSTAIIKLESKFREAKRETQEARKIIEQKQEEVDSLREQMAVAERKIVEKKRQLSGLNRDLESRGGKIESLRKTLQSTEAKRGELKEYYTKAYRSLKAVEKERDEAREDLITLEERQGEIESLASLAKRTIEAIEHYKARTGTIPRSIPPRKIPDPDHPMYKVLLALNGLIRTIEREDSLYDSSSADEREDPLYDSSSAESSPVKATATRRNLVHDDSFGADFPTIASSPLQDRKYEGEGQEGEEQYEF